jgi:hypothetical protein
MVGSEPGISVALTVGHVVDAMAEPLKRRATQGRRVDAVLRSKNV